MKHYNCIVVFNQTRDRILFCKRMKAPYQGLYNFVGGKVEPGEGSSHAAYRELFEETGIDRSSITLFHFMDMTYYHQEFVLELYVGQLREDVELVEEKNPLVWLPLTENFADSAKYAGDKNIAHIVSVALQYPIRQYEAYDVGKMREDVLTIGVDGCSGGWIVAVYENGNLRIERYKDMEELTAAYPTFDAFLIDMVIGFPSCTDDVRPDSFARKIIAQRASTIFAVPSRQAIYETEKESQIAANMAALNKSLGAQTRAIIPKMRELDEFLNTHEEYKNVIRESHPEVCFCRLNGSVVMSRKHDTDGLQQRCAILQKYIPDVSCEEILYTAKRLRCNADDIVDAICLMVTANLDTQSKTEAIPEIVQKDACGLDMQMVIPKA